MGGGGTVSDEAQTSCPQTTDPETTYLGVLGGAARMLRELLRSRRVTKTVRIVLSNLDPEAAPELVRVALFGDTMLFFDLLSASPRLANAAVLGAREAAVRLLEVPERLVDRYLPQLLRDLQGPFADLLGPFVVLDLPVPRLQLHADDPRVPVPDEGMQAVRGDAQG